MLSRRKRAKVFVIGRNKTGTTSMRQVLDSFGFRVADQTSAELMMEEWAKRDFGNIIKYCKTADAFQDVPFSLDFTYQAVDQAFPGSKFILTVRSSSQEWYESLIRFHTKILGKNRLPTADDLKAFSYRGIGWLWRQQQLVFGISERLLYDKGIYCKHYESHNQRVREYFRHRPEDLLELNLSDSEAMLSLCAFLGVKSEPGALPHLNKSEGAG